MDTSTTLELTLPDVEPAARVFAALADATRLRILSVLADTQQCVCDIQSVAPMAGSLLSYHLKTLREAGLIHGTRRGRYVDYCLTETAADLIRGALGAAGFSAVIDQPAGCAPDCEAATR